MPQAGQNTLLNDTEADALLQMLLRTRWTRLPAQTDDPLGLLYSTGAHQWTAGWDANQHNLYLLVWELHSWEQKPRWCLYRNGELLIQEEDGASRNRSALLHKLLESDQLPFTTVERLLEPLLDYRCTLEQREISARQLLTSILARPQMLETFKGILFQALETDLANREWPVLEVMKIHRVSHKNVLVRLFRDLVKTGLIRTLRDNTRLDRDLNLLQDDYLYLGCQVSPLFRGAFDCAYEEFRHLITQDTWRTGLRFKLPQNQPTRPDLAAIL